MRNRFRVVCLVLVVLLSACAPSPVAVPQPPLSVAPGASPSPITSPPLPVAPNALPSSSTPPPLVTPRIPPSSTTPPSTPSVTKSSSEIASSEARQHIGERITVVGKVMSATYATDSRGKPTFLNIGKPYPNQELTLLIWDNNRSKFPQSPEKYYQGKTIVIAGLIVDYQGTPQIEVTSPSQIQVR